MKKYENRKFYLSTWGKISRFDFGQTLGAYPIPFSFEWKYLGLEKSSCSQKSGS
jgi:hypothetical protein